MNRAMGHAAILWNIALSILILAVAVAIFITRPPHAQTDFEGNLGCVQHGGVERYEKGGSKEVSNFGDDTTTTHAPSLVFCSDGSFVAVK